MKAIMLRRYILCLLVISIDRGLLTMPNPPADTVFIMDATVTDPVECQCQKDIYIYIANYTYSQLKTYDNRFGLISYADAPILLYRLVWPLNFTQWNQVVNSMICTDFETILYIYKYLFLRNPKAEIRDSIELFILAQQMFSKGGRTNAKRSLAVDVSKLPTVSFTTAFDTVHALNVRIYAGIRVSTVSTSDLAILSTDVVATNFINYCYFLTKLPIYFPL